MDLQLLIGLAALALGLWLLLAPHEMHMSADLLKLNLSHEVHMAIGAALAAGSLWHLNQRYKWIKI
jgi:hypothetical protein